MSAPESLQALAQEAVLYAWPLYEMARMRAATSPKRTEAGAQAPEGQRWCNTFVHARQLLRAGGSRVVTPNHDTLYTNAWLDLGAGPLVIDVPDTAGRYYVLGLLDFYTNPFAHLGQRLTGTRARAFVIVPPGWQGELPAAFDAPGARIQAPTRWLWVIGRILVDGPHDVAAVNALQDGFPLAPHPFATAAAPLGLNEETLLARLTRLREIGAIARPEVTASVRPPFRTLLAIHGTSASNSPTRSEGSEMFTMRGANRSFTRLANSCRRG